MRTLIVTLVVGIVPYAKSALAHHRFMRHAFIRVGQNGYWVTSVYGRVMEDAQGVFRTAASEIEGRLSLCRP
jgi:hypothetical protein